MRCLWGRQVPSPLAGELSFITTLPKMKETETSRERADSRSALKEARDSSDLSAGGKGRKGDGSGLQVPRLGGRGSLQRPFPPKRSVSWILI